MPAALPIQISFNLPSGDWVSQDPDAAGMPNAAFLALRWVPGEYAPVLSVAGDYRDDPVTLTDIADEAVQECRAEIGADVRVLLRDDAGSAQTPGLLQILGFQLENGARMFTLRQAQVILGVPTMAAAGEFGSADTATKRRVALVLALTCEEDQLSTLLPEFRAFVDSVLPANPPG